MSQTLAGGSELRYDSRADRQPPAVFEDVAASVGVPISVITIDEKGKIIKSRAQTHQRRRGQRRCNHNPLAR